MRVRDPHSLGRSMGRTSTVRVLAQAVLAGCMGACVNLSYPSGTSRDGGFVAHLPAGAPCNLGSDCQSGFCFDEVCCTTACTGDCVTCAKSGSQGFCVPADVGTNPRSLCADQGSNSCGQTGVCDGAGMCQMYAAGTTCQEAVCAVHFMLASRCSGDGVCAPGQEQSCSPYLCGTAGRCLTQCASDEDCENGHKCVSGLCGKSALGTICSDGSDCDSGNCAQGVCCSTTCAGGCVSCALKGSEGACTPVPAGEIAPTSPACTKSDASTCGTDGTCDGAGMCRMYQAGTMCNAASCSNATLLNAAKCDGMGHCQIPAAVPCGGYICATTMACRTSCGTDGDCASPSVCGQASCGGLLAQYYQQIDLTDLAFSRTDPQVNFNWGRISPNPLLNIDAFAVRWSGKVTSRFSESYTFYAATDDGERLWINDQLIIDRWVRKPSVPEDVSAQVSLVAGIPADFKMEYFQSLGDASAVLSWSSKSEPKAVVPTSALSPQ
jgi:hypothetical protein